MYHQRNIVIISLIAFVHHQIILFIRGETTASSSQEQGDDNDIIDKNDEYWCGRWAYTGQCTLNPEYMLQNCRMECEEKVERDKFQIQQSLFRFPASKLGPGFDALLQHWYRNTLYADNTTITPDLFGKAHALHSVSTPAATLFRRQCYSPSPKTSSKKLHNLYKTLESRKKELGFQQMDDKFEEGRLMHTITQRLYHAFLPPKEEDSEKDARRMHKKKSKSNVNTIHAQTNLPANFDSPRRLSFQTGVAPSKSDDNEQPQQQYYWRSPAHFSSQGTSTDLQFRLKSWDVLVEHLEPAIQKISPNFIFQHARQSGNFWYPPGGVREWHTNELDLVGNMIGGGHSKEEEIFAKQTWRAYFVRTVRDEEFDKRLSKLRKGRHVDNSSNDHSAMHIIPGKDAGITLDVLKKAGARLLTKEEEIRQYSDEFAEIYTPPSENSNKVEEGQIDSTGLDRNSVWRLPDQDGYLTLFRLPDIWHCIVSEEVHRYSLGFAFSDEEVQALLTLADEDFGMSMIEENPDRLDEAADREDEL
jgi:hypothetical protein